MSWIKKKLVSLLIVILSCITGFLIVELSLRISKIGDPWHATEEGNILRNFQFTYDISNLYQSTSKNVNYVRNEHGLRDNCDSPEDVEILTIGGSTTDQRYVPYKFTYQKILEARLIEKVSDFGCVSNAGVNGHSTWGHLFAFEYWFPLIPKLNPKFILLYVGINDADFRRANTPISGYDNNDRRSIKDYLKKLEVVKALLPIYRLSRSQISNKYSAAYAGQAPRPYEVEDYKVTNPNKEIVGLSKKNAKAFKSRMIELLQNIKELNAIPICVTQPHRFIMKKNNQNYGIPGVLGDGFSGLDYDFSIRELNTAMFELCGENTLDLYNHSFLNSHFYDGVHTTALGSQEIGEIMAQFIIKRFY